MVEYVPNDRETISRTAGTVPPPQPFWIVSCGIAGVTCRRVRERYRRENIVGWARRIGPLIPNTRIDRPSPATDLSSRRFGALKPATTGPRLHRCGETAINPIARPRSSGRRLCFRRPRSMVVLIRYQLKQTKPADRLSLSDWSDDFQELSSNRRTPWARWSWIGLPFDLAGHLHNLHIGMQRQAP